jgi:hypothetical protein
MVEDGNETPIADAAAHIERGLAVLSAEDIEAVAAVELGNDIQIISSLMSRLELQRARRLRRFDAGHGHVPSGDGSTTNWLSRTCHLPGHLAERQVRFARQLPELEATQEAVKQGQIGIEHALEIARATDDMGPAAEEEMLAAAKQTDPGDLRKVARELRHRVDSDGLARLAQEQHRKRRLRMYELPDGMLGLEGALPVEGGVALRLTLESLIGIPPKYDDRTQQQRQADALMALCQRQLDSGRLPKVGGRKPHLTVVVRAETLAGEPGAPAAHLEGAGPISVETAKRLMCGASVSVLQVDGKGAALRLGRARRLATEPQRRVMEAKYETCIFSSCRWETRFCEPHHLDEWVLGGSTDVERMVPLCSAIHHHLVHEGGWRLEEQPDGTIVPIPPWPPPDDG